MKIKKKLFILIFESIAILSFLVSATYAWFRVYYEVDVSSMQVSVETTNDLLVKLADDLVGDFTTNFDFTIDSEFEMQAVTTVTAHSYFYEFGEAAEDEYGVPYGYIAIDYNFFSVGDLDVYLSDANGAVFTTTETNEDRQKIIYGLRLTFISYTEIDDGMGGTIRTYQEALPAIYALNDTETIVTQDTNYTPSATVPSFTTLGTSGTPVFSTIGRADNFIRMIIWLEGNDEDTIAALAESTFSVSILLEGVVTSG